MSPQRLSKLVAGVAFLSALLICGNLFAGVTGKIAGRVIDVDTGKPLPGANVLIVGTAMGAATDADGYYYVINVAVGTYSVSARMMGYEPLTMDGVKSVMDLTTTVNFSLKQTVIEVPGVTVTAERPMVIPDATATVHIVTTEEIEQLPIQNFQEAVEQQAGVIYTEGGHSGRTEGFHVRGGREDEIVFMVDGVSIQDPILGGPGADINISAVQEVVVLTGGYNAEYGQAMSGVVNLVTKEGGKKVDGMLRARTNAFLPDDGDLGYLNRGDQRYEASFGGPFPLYEDLRYFLSGEFSMRDNVMSANAPYRDEETDELVTGEPGAMSNTDREFYSGQAKLSYNINPDMKFTLGGFNSREQRGQYGANTGLPATGQWSNNDDKYKPREQRLSRREKSSQVTGTWTHMIGPSTFYTLTGAYFNSQRIYGQRDSLAEEERELWEDMPFAHWTTYDRDEDRERVDSLFDYPWGVPGGTNWGFVYGDCAFWRERVTGYWDVKLDLTSQVNEHNLIKFGLEGKRNEAKLLEGQYIAADRSTPAREDTNITECLYYDWYIDVDPETGDTTMGYYPMQADVYLQDKIEYAGFVANVGLRLDYLDAVAERLVNPLYPDSGKITADPKFQLSPRLGVSFPVTERTKFHFSYGRFFQAPELRWLYTNLYIDLMEGGGWVRIGNPDMSAQSTTAYEIGVAHQFAPTMALNLTGYYKDIYDLMATRVIAAIPKQYVTFITEDYGNVKGLEVILSKRADPYWSGKLAYGLSVAKGTASDATQAYYDYIANVPMDPYTGKPVVYPKSDYYLEFDQRHTISADLNFTIPDGMGPVLGEIRPLQNLNINLLNTAGSGFPYTERDASENIIGKINAKRMPWTWTTDLKLEKEFNIWNLTYSLFGEVTNLFNWKNILNVYPTTGKPDDDGKIETFDKYVGDTFPGEFLEDGQIEIEGHEDWSGVDPRRDLDEDGFITTQEWYDSYVAAYKDYLLSPFNYGSPRGILVGVSVSF